MAWILSSCISSEERIKVQPDALSPEEHINAQFDTLPQADSTLLYEDGGTSFNAKRDCPRTFQIRWYGTTMYFSTVIKRYRDDFSHNGWWADPMFDVWGLESADGAYRAGLYIVEDLKKISQEKEDHYKLPASVLAEAAHYRTVYYLDMDYARPDAVKKCRGY